MLVDSRSVIVDAVNDTTIRFDAAALIAGPCALPDAPLAMPRQAIEHETALIERVARFIRLRPRAFPAGSAEQRI